MSTVATFPLDEFSLPLGGVILKSSDGVEFKVYRNILSLASPFFCQMFTLPQTVNSGDSETNYDMQIIPVSESSISLDMLLRLIHPIDPPVLPGISETGDVTDEQALINAVDPVLAAALKYEMSAIVKDLTSRLLDAAEMTLPDGSAVNDTLALRMYILACRHKLKEEARRAAHAALKGRVYGVFVEELRHIDATHYFRLMQFHRKMVIITHGLVKHDAVPRPFYSDGCLYCKKSTSSSTEAWNRFVDDALPILAKSPRSSKVFKLSYGDVHVWGSCSRCNGLEYWDIACRKIQEEIETALTKNDIDLSEI